MNLRDQYKTHDTEEKQKDERELLSSFIPCVEAGASFEQKGIGAPYDASMRDATGKLIAIVEAKTRNRERASVDHFKIDVQKVRKLRALHRVYGVPILLVVRFSDGELAHLDLASADPSTWQKIMFKRPDRKEKPDLTYLIPMQEFQKCKKENE